MKLKTILLIFFCIVIAALIGANIYDFYKQDSFRTKIDVVREELKNEDYSVQTFSVDSVKKIKFITSIKSHKKSGTKSTLVKTEIYNADTLVGVVANDLNGTISYSDSAILMKPQGEILLYVCSEETGAISMNASVFIVEYTNEKWQVKSLSRDEIKRNSEFARIILDLEKRTQ